MVEQKGGWSNTRMAGFRRLANPFLQNQVKFSCPIAISFGEIPDFQNSATKAFQGLDGGDGNARGVGASVRTTSVSWVGH